jgi:hypothetical protein
MVLISYTSSIYGYYQINYDRELRICFHRMLLAIYSIKALKCADLHKPLK